MIADFRRGFHPAWFRYERLLYRRVPTNNAEAAWRRVVEPPDNPIKYSRRIARALGVSPDTSRRYLRLYEALGLLTYYRGTWNNASLDEMQPAFDWDNTEWSEDDENPDYGEWTAPWDFNDPAVIYLNTHDPAAFTWAVEKVTKGVPCDLYVPATNIETPSDNGEVSRFVDRLPEVWTHYPTSGGWGVWEGTVSNVSPDLTTLLSSTSTTGGLSDGVRHFEWQQRAVAAPLLVVELPGPAAGRSDASEASTGRGCQTVSQDPSTFTIPDLVETHGWSRATANRWVTRWIEEGRVERVSYGRYGSTEQR